MSDQLKSRLLNGEAFVPGPKLIDTSGRALIPDKAPERVTAVKFLRGLAEEFGGINTSKGQAIHRAAGHMVMLHEEMRRLGHLKDLAGEHTREKLEAAAEGIYNVTRHKVMEATGGQRVPDAWAMVLKDRPEEAENYIHMATAALGGPVYVPPCTDEEAEECKQDS